MSNIATLKEFNEKYPDKGKFYFGDSVGYIYISDKELLIAEGVVWQTWSDGSITIVTDDSFRNVNKNHIRLIPQTS
jgi:hypothetical protein